MYVCLCKGITDSQIRTAVAEGASKLSEVRASLGVASQCCKCAVQANAIIREELAALDPALFYAA